MEFTEQVLGSCCPVFCDDCRLVAHGSGTLAVLRDAETLDVLSEFECNGAVAQARVSPDGQYLLCILKKGAAAYVFDLTPDSDFSCMLSEGGGGLAHARWAPSSRHILTLTDFGLRATCWSIADGSTTQLAVSPKYTDGRGLVFTPDGQCALVLERTAGVDTVTVFSSCSWTQPESRWRTGTQYTEELACTAASDVVLWDVDAVCLHALDGLLLARFQDGGGGGIRACVCSPQLGGLVACLTHDHALLLLEGNTLQCAAVLPHTAVVRGPPSAVVYREEAVPMEASPTGPSAPVVRFAVAPAFPVNISKPASGHSGSASIISKQSGAAAWCSSCIAWNRDGNVVAVRNEAIPHCVWLWDVERLMLLSVLHLRGPVRSMSWEAASGGNARLAVATGGRQIYMWSPNGASTVTVPQDEFKAGTVAWSEVGSLLLVQNNSTDAFAIGYAGS